MNKLIYILSPARSGSTMMDLTFGNDDQALSLGEVYAQFWPWRKHHFNSICSCGNENCTIHAQIINENPDSLYPSLFEKYDFLVDSSKNLEWVLSGHRNARQHNFQIENILIYKDPIDLAFSHYKRGEDYLNLANYYSYFQRFLDTGLPFVSISFNQYVQNPETFLPSICNYLSIPYFEGKSKYWEKESHHFFGSQSVVKMIDQNDQKITKQRVYPEEFQKLIPQIEQQINSDQKLQSILNQLEQRDIILHPDLAYQANSLQFQEPSLIWKTLKKINRFRRKLFPEDYRVSH